MNAADRGAPCGSVTVIAMPAARVGRRGAGVACAVAAGVVSVWHAPAGVARAPAAAALALGFCCAGVAGALAHVSPARWQDARQERADQQHVAHADHYRADRQV